MALYVEIVTPDGIVWKNDNVESVTMPTRSGEIQILPGHVPLVTILEAGDLCVVVKGRREDLAVDKGYARCIADQISVITEAAIDIKDIDESEADKAMARAQKALEEAKNSREIDPDEIERLEAVIRFAMAQMLVKGKKK